MAEARAAASRGVPIDVGALGPATADVVAILNGSASPRRPVAGADDPGMGERSPNAAALELSSAAIDRYWDDTVAVAGESWSRPAVRDRLAADAVDRALQGGDPGLIARCRLRHALAIWAPGVGEQRRSLADDVLATAVELGRGDLEIGARLVRATDHLRRWSLADFHAEVAAMERLVPGDDTGLAAWLVELWRGALSLVAGRLDLAASSARTAYDLAGRHQLPVRPEGQLLASRHLVARLRGDPQQRSPVDDAVGRETLPPSWALAAAHRDAGAGRLGPARHRYEQVARSGFDSVPENMTWATSIVLAAETAIVLGDTPRFGLLATKLERLGDDVIVVGPGHAVYGPATLAAARLARATGDSPSAAALAERSLAVAPTGPFGALAELELARSGRRVRPDRELAEDFDAYGMAVAAAAARSLESAPRSPRAGGLEHARLTIGPRTATFEASGRSASVPMSVGIGYLAELLRRPQREVHALELAAPDSPVERGDAVIDELGVAALRTRLTELDDELRHESDAARAALLREEFDGITDHLARALGMTGARRSTSTSERARSAVTKAIRRAIASVLEVDRDLGLHLDAAVRTGSFCAYAPEDGRRWTVTRH